MNSHYLTGSKTFWSLLLIIVLRYLVLAFVAWLIYYVIRRKAWQFKKIQPQFPAASDYLRETGYSIVTAFIFAAVGYVIFVSPVAKYTMTYYTVSDYGVPYLLLSVVMMIVLHDTYFYWMHRAMHHRSIYRIVHRVHHLSLNPSPWAAMAFHPIEAFLETGILIIVPFLFPVHPLAVGLFLLFMMIYNVYGHLGYEWYPAGFSRSRVGKWINTSVNHNLHHQYFKGNYGLYFLFWDRLMGTLRTDYDDAFEQVQRTKQ